MNLLKYYNRIITFLVRDAEKRAKEKGVVFDEENCRRKNEAWLPIILFYVVLWIISVLGLNIISVEIYLLTLLCLSIRGLNHYFGWIKFVKDDQ
tara:strand:- start:454 stop:735 length:282 start_codon:yes stop_codon:yes gene_type:complete